MYARLSVACLALDKNRKCFINEDVAPKLSEEVWTTVTGPLSLYKGGKAYTYLRERAF